MYVIIKDLSKVKPIFKSVPLLFYFEIAGLFSAKKWQEIQNMTRGMLLKPAFTHLRSLMDWLKLLLQGVLAYHGL